MEMMEMEASIWITSTITQPHLQISPIFIYKWDVMVEPTLSSTLPSSQNGSSTMDHALEGPRQSQSR